MNRTYCLCSKCGEDKPQTLHHPYPQTHFGKGQRNPLTIGLCQQCHTNIENIVLAVESYMGDVPFGQRYELSKRCYNKIHRQWLRNAKIIQLYFTWKCTINDYSLLSVMELISIGMTTLLSFNKSKIPCNKGIYLTVDKGITYNCYYGIIRR